MLSPDPIISPGAHVSDLASRVLSPLERRFGADSQACFGHPLWLLETIFDPRCFHGTSYRAASWLAVGEPRLSPHPCGLRRPPRDPEAGVRAGVDRQRWRAPVRSRPRSPLPPFPHDRQFQAQRQPLDRAGGLDRFYRARLTCTKTTRPSAGASYSTVLDTLHNQGFSLTLSSFQRTLARLRRERRPTSADSRGENGKRPHRSRRRI